jgi:hypothetical protein
VIARPNGSTSGGATGTGSSVTGPHMPNNGPS